jgi:uncharacterized membrane protein YcaP (DUF421 family)
MEPLFRTLFMYFFLLLIVRISGKRTLAQVTTFDFVLLLVISESAQQAITGDDFSVTNAVVLITVLVLTDIILSLIKRRSKKFDTWLDGTPLILVKEGNVLQERLDKTRVDLDDILESARKLRGLHRLEQIRFAILEKDGGITIIPNDRE